MPKSSYKLKFLFIYFSLYIPLALLLFFSLKTNARRFDPQSLHHLTDTVSTNRDHTSDLCRYQMLGDPDVGTQYVKIRLWCDDGRQTISTMALTPLSSPTVKSALNEYARIINFDPGLLQYCQVNDQTVTGAGFDQSLSPASTINCYQSHQLFLKHVKK